MHEKGRCHSWPALSTNKCSWSTIREIRTQGPASLGQIPLKNLDLLNFQIHPWFQQHPGELVSSACSRDPIVPFPREDRSVLVKDFHSIPFWLVCGHLLHGAASEENSTCILNSEHVLCKSKMQVNWATRSCISWAYSRYYSIVLNHWKKPPLP